MSSITDVCRGVTSIYKAWRLLRITGYPERRKRSVRPLQILSLIVHAHKIAEGRERERGHIDTGGLEVRAHANITYVYSPNMTLSAFLSRA